MSSAIPENESPNASGENPEESFAAMFEQSEKGGKSKGKAARPRGLRVGATLEATVVQVGRDNIFVELDGKRQAFMDVTEFRAPDGTVAIKAGDKITAQIIEMDEKSGEVRMGRTMGRAGNLGGLEQARNAGLPVEGKVTGINKGGLDVELGGGARGFCPMSQADIRFVQDPSTLVGKSLTFLVTDIRDGGKSIVVSRRAVLERESREASSRILKELTKGSVVRGTVTGVRDFGAFVDLGGVEGLIPASEISHERGVNVGDHLKAGDVVDVQVREVKEVAPVRQNDATIKITLSLKALTADPWDQAGEELPTGKVVFGPVTRITEFGAFVRVAPGIEGLLHVSELGGGEAAQKLAVGTEVPVVIKAVDVSAKRVSLTLAPDGALPGARVKPVSFSIGTVVTGVVERIETYGVFLQLDSTKGRAGRGLVPNAELGVPRGTDVRKAFPEGAKVKAKVLEVGDGRLRLSIRSAKDAEERSQFEGFRDTNGASATLGTLGDLLRGKIGKKK